MTSACRCLFERRPVAIDDSPTTGQPTTITGHLDCLTTTHNSFLNWQYHTNQYSLHQQSLCPIFLCYYRRVPALFAASSTNPFHPIMITPIWGRRGARPWINSLTILLPFLAPTPTVQLSQALCSSQNTGVDLSPGTSIIKSPQHSPTRSASSADLCFASFSVQSLQLKRSMSDYLLAFRICRRARPELLVFELRSRRYHVHQ